ncbi:MAG: ATP-binding protein [Fibromonadaceae bacterium]|jgi:hypothetical protein|nr:ATP-binding protein [Fibromonadaceae bacterium]
MPIEAAIKNYIVEKLSANNFLSLHNFKYEHEDEQFKQFNVITGDMASGKSLVLKLLEFFNNIYAPLMGMGYTELVKKLEFDNFSKMVIIAFMIRFNLKGNMVFDITYSCSYKDVIFSIKLFRKAPEENIQLESEFLDKQLKEWKDYVEFYIKSKKDKREESKNSKREYSNYFGEFISPQELSWLKDALYKMLSSKFKHLYPSATIFIPATRASLATRLPLNKRIEDDRLNFQDYYLNAYERLIESIKSFPETKYRDRINDILKAIIRINGDIHLLSKEGREVDICNASSGQQESFYILFLLEKLPILKEYYGNCNMYIEEPEAHLFPLEQKLILELIAQIFNDINNKAGRSPIKFYITTHSPYVLNTINNMLIKGNIIKNNKERIKQIENDENTESIPHLNYENVSAVFINNEGNVDPILKEYDGDYLINPVEINNIEKCINDGLSNLDELKTKLKNKNA